MSVGSIALMKRKLFLALWLLTTVYLASASITSAFVTLSSFQAKPASENKPGGVVLAWVTGTEVNSAGFNIYRSEHIDGPYIRINVQLIPSSVGLLAGGTYEYHDANALPDRTYYYQMEDVELTGTNTRHPPLKVNIPATTASPLSILIVGLAGTVIIAGASLAILIRKQRQSTLSA